MITPNMGLTNYATLLLLVSSLSSLSLVGGLLSSPVLTRRETGNIQQPTTHRRAVGKDCELQPYTHSQRAHALAQRGVTVLTALSLSSASTLLHAQEVSAADEPEITDRVFLDIKIANYTEESIGRNLGATGSGMLVLGLYGKAAPLSVKRFLSTVTGDGETAPSYYNTIFSRVTPDSSVLEIEKVPGVNKVYLAGSEQYEYQGNYLADYYPILEPTAASHSCRGLLTRKKLTVGPEFGITLNANPKLDDFNIVFGRVLSGKEVLDAIAEVPVYTYKTKTGYVGTSKSGNSASDELADKWFEGQKKFLCKRC